MALALESKRAIFGERILADFGSDPWELLECVPNYRHVVVGLNAAYARMLHSFGFLQKYLGNSEPLHDFDRLSRQVAEAVTRQYAGGGRWKVSFPDHDEVIGHCLDFQLVAAEIPEYLTDTMKEEMVEFVVSHLIDGDWMRALDPKDPIAPFSDRPDHGAAGAFGAWPADTCYGLIQLGRTDVALEFLRRLPRSTSGAVWGQAIEAVEGGRYRVAERGVSNRETGAAVAILDTVVAGLFGVKGDFTSLTRQQGSTSISGARLTNIRAIGYDLAPRDVGADRDAAPRSHDRRNKQ
jgi:hypothetical protein